MYVDEAAKKRRAGYFTRRARFFFLEAPRPRREDDAMLAWLHLRGLRFA
jgi:hypothetical protein